MNNFKLVPILPTMAMTREAMKYIKGFENNLTHDRLQLAIEAAISAAEDQAIEEEIRNDVLEEAAQLLDHEAGGWGSDTVYNACYNGAAEAVRNLKEE